MNKEYVYNNTLDSSFDAIVFPHSLPVTKARPKLTCTWTVRTSLASSSYHVIMYDMSVDVTAADFASLCLVINEQPRACSTFNSKEGGELKPEFPIRGSTDSGHLDLSLILTLGNALDNARGCGKAMGSYKRFSEEEEGGHHSH